MARSSIIAILVFIAFTGCSDSKHRLVIGENAEKSGKEILLALFKESEQKIDMEACESHTFTLVGEFLADIILAEGGVERISLQCPKEENEKLFCEFNIDHGQDNTLVRFVYNKKSKRLLKTFTPLCIRVP